MTYRSNLETFLSVVTGKPFIKSSAFAEELKTLFIHFYNSYEEYLNDNPHSQNTKEDYLNYFGTKSIIEKWIVLEPARILRDYTEIDNVEVTLPFEGKVYHATVNREQLNKFIGFDITTLNPNDPSWTTKFANIYGYGLKNEKRKALFEHFTKVTDL